MGAVLPPAWSRGVGSWQYLTLMCFSLHSRSAFQSSPNTLRSDEVRTAWITAVGAPFLNRGARPDMESSPLEDAAGAASGNACCRSGAPQQHSDQPLKTRPRTVSPTLVGGRGFAQYPEASVCLLSLRDQQPAVSREGEHRLLEPPRLVWAVAVSQGAVCFARLILGETCSLSYWRRSELWDTATSLLGTGRLTGVHGGGVPDSQWVTGPA